MWIRVCTIYEYVIEKIKFPDLENKWWIRNILLRNSITEIGKCMTIKLPLIV